MSGVGVPNSLPAKPHPPLTPTCWRWDSRLPSHTILIKRLACGRPPLHFEMVVPGVYINFWKKMRIFIAQSSYPELHRKRPHLPQLHELRAVFFDAYRFRSFNIDLNPTQGKRLMHC